MLFKVSLQGRKKAAPRAGSVSFQGLGPAGPNHPRAAAGAKLSLAQYRFILSSSLNSAEIPVGPELPSTFPVCRTSPATAQGH